MDTIIAHSFVEHTRRLNSLCRLCGGRVSRISKDKQTAAKKCSTYASDISVVYKVNVHEDVKDKHSLFMCTKCYALLVKWRRSGTHIVISDGADFDVWRQFDEHISIDNCVTCSHFHKWSKAGRPKKVQSEKVLMILLP